MSSRGPELWAGSTQRPPAGLAVLGSPSTLPWRLRAAAGCAHQGITRCPAGHGRRRSCPERALQPSQPHHTHACAWVGPHRAWATRSWQYLAAPAGRPPAARWRWAPGCTQWRARRRTWRQRSRALPLHRHRQLQRGPQSRICTACLTCTDCTACLTSISACPAGSSASLEESAQLTKLLRVGAS